MKRTHPNDQGIRQRLESIFSWKAKGIYTAFTLRLFLLTLAAFAQITTGSLPGTVSDSTDAEIPNATLTLTPVRMRIRLRD